MLKRAKSSISYEVSKKRKGGAYKADFAAHKTYVRRRRNRFVTKKIVADKELRKFIDDKLKERANIQETKTHTLF